MSGLSLKAYIEDMRKIWSQLELLQQAFCNLNVVPGLQMALNLSSPLHEEFPMTWDALLKGGYFPDSMDLASLTEGQPPQALLFKFSAFERCILRDLKGLRDCMKKVSPRFPGNHFMNLFFDVIEGMAGVALFLHRNKRKYKAQTQQAMKRLQAAAKDGSSDACIFHQLLEAIMSTVAWPRVSAANVKKRFDAAVVSSGACCLYNEWGAHKKVKLMQNSYDFIQVKSSAHSYALRGRSRISDSSRRGSFRDLLEKEIATCVVEGE
ncbi:expressed unknown protein [Seminavis robusta]|uniref:Uncharacterized protein n=1 Tax=Seminavis robusta TaxID=568900 RepID=A0A9N8EST3_9STRA|nr:expressed unknown protein [Seminavis robusta]|eukprot:Sro1774_g296760.1 n/a (265) ;mRNA; r:3774-4725